MANPIITDSSMNPLASSEAFMDFLHEVIGKGLEERGVNTVLVMRKRILEIVPVGTGRVCPLVMIGFLQEPGDELKTNWSGWTGGA